MEDLGWWVQTMSWCLSIHSTSTDTMSEWINTKVGEDVVGKFQPHLVVRPYPKPRCGVLILDP